MSHGGPAGEVAVVGLGRSGLAAATLLAREGRIVYASDASDAPAAQAAAASLRAAGIHAEAGRHDLERVARSALLVASPGIAPTAPPLAAARAAGVPIVGEVEVALRAMADLRYVAVTGTNGKTTVTALAAHLLQALGLDAVAAGNIGTPLAEIALHVPRPAWVALELSSFQLHDTPSIAPVVGVVTNLSPDHLDRYTSVEDYYADKARLFTNATDASRWVLNGDDAAVEALPADAPGVRYRFSLSGRRAHAWYDRDAAALVLLGEPLVRRAELPLMGEHNVANALAATLAVAVADDRHRDPVARERLAAGLRSFRALPHRLAVVGEIDGVQWIDDSKATNVASARAAIAGMVRPAVVLLGGRHKGEPYTVLAEPLARVARAVIAYGEAAPLIAHDLSVLAGLVRVECLGSSFEEVIARARALAQPGDAVLLSPACSSYDMFRNYEERGAAFAGLASSPRRIE